MVALAGRLFVPIAVTVFAVAFFAAVRGMDVESRLYPQIVIVALLLVTWVDAGGIVTQWSRDRATGAGRAGPVQPIRRSAYTAVLTTAYVGLAIPQLGFYPATFVFLICLAAVLGLRNPWKLAALGAVTTACCFLVFDEVFALRLPTGPWI